MTASKKIRMPDWLPFAVGALLVIQFAGLGVWQIGRGFEKQADRDAFRSRGGATSFVTGMAVRPYQRLRATGRFDSARQFLLDNIMLNSRYGYYVLTPLAVGDGEPLLIVNRGWIERAGKDFDTQSIALLGTDVTVRGRVGSLPRAGYRMGDAILAGATWPQHAVYPTLDELASSLGQEVQPFVLLMDPDDDHGLLRHWVPAEMGPSRHFGYAFQWFAMGAVLAAMLIWNFRRRKLRR